MLLLELGNILYLVGGVFVIRLGCLPLFLFFPLALLGFWIITLLDVLRRPEHTFRSSTDRALWIVIVFFGNFIGAFIYQLFGKDR